MKRLIIPLCLLSFLLLACPAEKDPCEGLEGTYVGSLKGLPLRGEITLYVTSSAGGGLEVTGNWNGNSGLIGTINRCDLNCNTGEIDYEYGVNLSGPFDVVCPNGELNSTGCYDTGATLGRFEGKITASGGGGTWQANSGAADYLGVVGSGTWTVTRQ